MSTLTALSEILEMERETFVARTMLWQLAPQDFGTVLEEEDDYFGTS